ncbi:MAG: hypothetical protein ABSD72_18805 [Terracidiphilus sp.]|jgi:hypothetical protein
MNRKVLADMNCPTPVSWANDVQKLFTPTDVAHMKAVTHGALDLSSYDSVKIWSAKIYDEVSSGNMPPPPESKWTDLMVQTFGCWIQQGFPQ